ncbi:MAG TPA: TonB-dependent receptor, partial [Gemmatimonadaceae bacterium]|nr:TonB-dependent receptor [Gemmatimonadaceae bacterium]
MKTFLLALLLAPVALGAQVTDTLRTSTDTSRAARALEVVTVSAIRGRNEAPISSTAISQEEIERRYFGQDVPLLLQGTPSLTSYAETGNYWGYSYMRLRGIDQSRINLSLDGIPLNDPEDQVLYFADFPDLANSIGSIQVQRGVGTSAPGTASYGGSINFQTQPLGSSERGGELQLQRGSFGSTRGAVEYQSGLTSRGFAVSARLSALQSAGYRHRSGMEGRSAFLSAGYLGERDIIKVIALAGLFADTLAYIGATPTELGADRRHNPLRPDEVDRFGEQVVGLSYTRQLRKRNLLATTLYRISASGGYDVCIAACDQPQGELWNFNLDFAWYGATSVWSLDNGPTRVSIGANANTYERDHHAYARPAMDTPLYFNTGHKDDASAFAKIARDLGALTLFVDVQGRHARFTYEPDANAGVSGSSIDWTFLNPKVGGTLRVGRASEIYASYGVNSREPARADMLGGFDNLDTTNADFVGPLDRVRPERADDFELGTRWRGATWSVQANAFAMRFRNEILPVGRLTYIGTPLRTNVRSSSRRGVELDVTLLPLARLEIGATATAMRGKIDQYTDDESGLVHSDVEPLLTPRFTSAQRLIWRPRDGVTLVAVGQYSGRSLLDNTGNPSLVLPASFVANASAEWTVGSHALSLHMNNVTDTDRFGGGHVSFGEARYYVLPPRSVFLQA